MTDEKILIAQAQKGNIKSISELVDRYLPFVHSLALRISGNQMDADDIAQETMIKVFKKIKRFRREASLKTWIYRITINQAYKTMNAKKKSLINDTIDSAINIIDNSPSPLERIIDRGQQEMLKKAIEILPQKQKLTVLLRIEHEMPFKEIARVMKRSEGAVKANYFHGINRLKKHFERSDNHEHQV